MGEICYNQLKSVLYGRILLSVHLACADREAGFNFFSESPLGICGGGFFSGLQLQEEAL